MKHVCYALICSVNIYLLYQLKRKTESDMALAFVECMNKMNGPPKVIMTDGEGAIKNRKLFENIKLYIKISYIPTKGRPVLLKEQLGPLNTC